MPAKSSLPALFLVAAALLGSSCMALRVVAAPPAEQASAFRRPAEFDRANGAAERDSVWALGQRIFFDPRMSASGTLSCASCHQPGHAWTDQRPKAVGEAHRPLAFRAPTLLNAGYIDRYGWTGRFPDIETTAFFAMGSPTNMNFPVATLLAKLNSDAGYIAAFQSAFSAPPNKKNVGAALERFVGSIVSDVAPFDRWIDGDRDAISTDAIRGFAIFTGKGKCAECHMGWSFTDGSFHDVGTASGNDLGRGAFFKSSVKLKYAFKTPTLRDVALRPPYMHDGSIATLEGVVDHYDNGGIDRPSRALTPLGLTPPEKADLVAFLRTLTGGSKFAIKSETRTEGRR